MLQQILFYRELDFPLTEIQRILNNSDFDKIAALISHKEILKNSLDRTQRLIKTIDKTISHLRGKASMKDEELYYGFDSEKQKQHEKFLVDNGILTQDFLDQCNEKVKDWTDKQKNDFILDMEKIYKKLINEMENKTSPSSPNVQQLMHEHFQWLERTWFPNKESYLGLIDLYQTPEFRKFYDKMHPKFLAFMIEAMKVYAENKLS